MNTTANKLHALILQNAASAGAVVNLVRTCFQTGDNALITDCANRLDLARDKQGKDWVNARLSVLRKAMATVCKELEIPKLTVARTDKSVEGNMRIVEATESSRGDKLTDFEAALMKLVTKADEENQMATLRAAIAKLNDQLASLSAAHA